MHRRGVGAGAIAKKKLAEVRYRTDLSDLWSLGVYMMKLNHLALMYFGI